MSTEAQKRASKKYYKSHKEYYNKKAKEYQVKVRKERNEYKQKIDEAIEYIEKLWKEKSYYESVENCLKFATMNEFEKEDLIDILEGKNEYNK